MNFFYISILANSVAHVQAAIEHIFPLVYEFRKPRPPKEPVPAPTQEVFLPEHVSEDEGEEELVSGPDNDDDGVDDIIEGPTAHKRALKGTNHRIEAKRCKRPAGKVENDPFDDLICVSDGEEDDKNVSNF